MAEGQPAGNCGFLFEFRRRGKRIGRRHLTRTIIGKPRDMIYLSSMQRALVTGGAGFIGSQVTAGFRVRSLDNLATQIHVVTGQYQAANAALRASGMMGVGSVS